MSAAGISELLRVMCPAQTMDQMLTALILCQALFAMRTRQAGMICWCYSSRPVLRAQSSATACNCNCCVAIATCAQYCKAASRRSCLHCCFSSFSHCLTLANHTGVQDHIQDPHTRLAGHPQRHADRHKGHSHAEHYLLRVWTLVRPHCHQREWVLDCSRAGTSDLLCLGEHSAERQALLWVGRPGL